jgi:putative ABC transport system permease protein
MTLKIIQLSLKEILKNKLRSILTMLGIIIGVMAVVILVSITQSASKGISSSISSMGSDQITATVTDEDISLTADEVESLSSNRSIDSVAPVITTKKTVKHGSESGFYSVNGVTDTYFTVEDIDIQSGRIIEQSDLDWNTNVAVLGTDVAYDLFGTWDAAGGTIAIGDRIYKVVGVLQEQGDSLSGSADSKILIPFTTAEIVTGSTSVSTFYVKASSSDSVDMAKNMISSYLLRITRDEDSFTVSNESDVLSTMEDVNSTMSLLLGGIAAISLLVGGIGIMNIMLVSVTERTREIGIRKAVGAKRKHILFQFLCESCILSVMGGLIGLLISYGVVSFYNLISGSSAEMNWTIGLASIAFCGVIGILFRSYPAAKASRLQPIDALHTA